MVLPSMLAEKQKGRTMQGQVILGNISVSHWVGEVARERYGVLASVRHIKPQTPIVIMKCCTSVAEGKKKSEFKKTSLGTSDRKN